MSDKCTRIGLLGAMGVGKTTLIRSICGELRVDSDVPNLDASHSKATTTVGIDFGEVDLGSGRLQIYGCPGQQRFEPVRDWVLSIVQVACVLFNPSEPHQNLKNTLLEIRAAQPQLPIVVGIARPASPEQTQQLVDVMADLPGAPIPVFEVNALDRVSSLEFLELTSQLLALESI